MHATLVNDPDLGRQVAQQDIGTTFGLTIEPVLSEVEPMNLADLQFWMEDRPCRQMGGWRFCWVSRKTLRCEIYSKYTCRACEKALDRLWPEFQVR